MTLLKRQSGYGTCEDAQLSLEGENGERSLGTRFVGFRVAEQSSWGYYMDETREVAGNDRAWRGGRAITYRHFVISPDPSDDIDLEALMSLTMEWANEFFGTDFEEGRCGSYQVVMVPHNDNENHILHTHVIVNNTNLENGYRLQINNATNAALWDRLQEMSAERGLSAFKSEREHREARKERRAERAKLAKDKAEAE